MVRTPSDAFRCLAALALLGCAKPAPLPVEAPHEREVTLEEVVEAQRSASELALVAKLLTRAEPTYRTPPPSEYTGPVACEKVSRGALHQRFSLRFGPGEPPFGVFEDGLARVVVPASNDRPKSLYVTSDNGGLVVHAVVEPGELVLYPSIPTLLGGFVVIGTKAPVALEVASLGGLSLRYELEPSDSVTTTLRAVRGLVTCDDLDLAPGKEDANDGFLEPVIEGRTLQPSQRLPLALVPGGRAVTHLRVEEPVSVSVLASDGPATKIVIWRSNDLLFGWVPSSALGPAPPCCEGDIGVLGHGVGTGTGQGFGDFDRATCPFDVPLEIEQAGRRRRVGFVREGTRMCLDELGNDFAEIHLHEGKVKFAPGVKLLVERSLLDRCKLKLEPKLEQSERHPAWPRTSPRIESR